MAVKDLKEYSILKKEYLEDLKAEGLLLKHNKSGARIVLIPNDDENKVFYIGFRTPPKDSTGVTHIIEHSVLCGSKKYPVKDPFVELAKGSLNTFLNAMTYPDKTVYPVASCNDKDFQNLIDVYMDAVFNPNMYEIDKIFMQEGWHYEMEAPDNDLEISGVVYNEMKGVFSSPEGVLEREVFNSLYPDTAYSYESGGAPENIPDLTYEGFLDFHKTYYHPSNSYIFIYGNCDMEEKLKYLDEEYLGSFDYLSVDSAMQMQKPFDKVIDITKDYSITLEENEEDNTYLSYNRVIDTALDPELYVAFSILDYVLFSAPGAPVKQKLLDEKICKDVMSSYDNGVLQPYISIIAKNANEKDKDRFVELINEALKDQAENGINKDSILGALNVFEFRYRESDYGFYPKGLMLGLNLMDSWLYDENEPFMHLKQNNIFAALREKMNNGYFEELIKKYLLNNPHGSVVTIRPVKGLTAIKDKELADKLKAYKDSLSEDEIKAIVETTKELKLYQSEPSSQEDLEKIPLLSKEDIRKDVIPYKNEELDVPGILTVHHDYFTNGIGYLNIYFKVESMPDELLPYAALLQNILGYVDTERLKYTELFDEMNINTGGVSKLLQRYTYMGEKSEEVLYFKFVTKAFYNKMDYVFDIIEEIINTSKFVDYKRIYEIIAMVKSRVSMQMLQAGHALAALRAQSYFDEGSNIDDKIDGIEFYKFVDNLEKNFETLKEEFVEKLQLSMKYIFRKDNMIVSYTAEKQGLEGLKENILKLNEALVSENVTFAVKKATCEQKNEGFKTSGKIQFVCRAGSYKDAGLEYNGSLRVLNTIFSYDYLWINVRVKGGAYGCMNSFTRTGPSYFVSYRDPHLRETNTIYEEAASYVESFDASERDMTKYIIGTISGLDRPLTPKLAGGRSMRKYLNNLTVEMLQKERDELLGTTVSDIRALAPYVKAVTDNGSICVIGGEETIMENSDLFKNLVNLL